MGDELGQKIISVEMSFLRDLKNGVIYDPEYLTLSN